MNEFLEKAKDFIVDAYEAVEGILGKVLDLLESIASEAPGLIDTIIRLYDIFQGKIDGIIPGGGNEEDVKKARAESREALVAQTKAEHPNVSESMIRQALEGVHTFKKAMRGEGKMVAADDRLKKAVERLNKGFVESR